MAPLLRASFHSLRRSRLVPLSSQRELLKNPESSNILRRWFGESAALEETCSSTQTANDTAGESRAVIPGEDSSKLADAQGSLKETRTANVVKEECDTKEPSSTRNTRDLTNIILGKMRSKSNPAGPKDNAVPLQAESTSSKANLPEGSSQHVRVDKWDQVMNSMRSMNWKRRGNLASGGAMPNLAKTEGENQDDFADLDLPQARGEAVPSKLSNNSDSFSRAAVDAFRNFTPNAKPKDGVFQGLIGKQKDNGFHQKAKDVKPVSFSFLKSLDDTARLGEDNSRFSSNASNSKDSLSNLKSTSQPINFDFLKSLGAKNEPTHEARSISSHAVKSASPHEVKSASSHETKIVSSHESKSAFIERPGKASSNENEVTNTINRTAYPGYIVCIRNLPSHSNLALVKEALSLHGEVISSFKKSNSDGTCNAFVEFKTAEAMDGALASRWVNFDSKAFTVVRADVPITTVVRLSKVSTETTDSQLFSICEKFGGIDNIKRRGNGVYDVFYRTNELSSMSTILDSLNEVTLNQRRLEALPAPLLHPAIRKEVLKGSEGQAWLASQLSQTLNRIECGLDIVSVCFEDLKILTAMEDELIK